MVKTKELKKRSWGRRRKNRHVRFGKSRLARAALPSQHSRHALTSIQRMLLGCTEVHDDGVCWGMSGTQTRTLERPASARPAAAAAAAASTAARSKGSSAGAGALHGSRAKLMSVQERKKAMGGMAPGSALVDGARADPSLAIYRVPQNPK